MKFVATGLLVLLNLITTKMERWKVRCQYPPFVFLASQDAESFYFLIVSTILRYSSSSSSMKFDTAVAALNMGIYSDHWSWSLNKLMSCCVPLYFEKRKDHKDEEIMTREWEWELAILFNINTKTPCFDVYDVLLPNWAWRGSQPIFDDNWKKHGFKKRCHNGNNSTNWMMQNLKLFVHI